MRFRFFEQASPFTKLVLTVGVIAVSALLFTAGGFLFVSVVFHLSWPDILIVLSNTLQPENVAILKYLQIIQAIGIFIIPAIFLAWLFYGKVFWFFGFDKQINFYSLLLVVVSVFLSVPVINLLASLNEKMVMPGFLSGVEQWMKEKEQLAKELTELFLVMPAIGDFLINLLMIGIIPAFGEEMLFRGIFQHIFINFSNNKHIGVIVAAFLFSAIHLQFYGFIPRFLLGIYFGYLFIWSGTLWLPVIAHFINNSGAVVFYYLAGKEMVNKDIENIGAENSITWSLLCIPLLVYIIYLIWENESRLKDTELSGL